MCRAARHSRQSSAVCASTQARRPISNVRCVSGSNGPNGSPARGRRLSLSAATRIVRLVVLHRDDRGGEPDLDRCPIAWRSRALLLRRAMLIPVEPKRYRLHRRMSPGPMAVDRGDHAALAAEDSVGERHEQACSACGRRDAPRIARAIVGLVAVGIERAGGDEGARGRTADAGIAMDDDRRRRSQP